MVEVVLVNGARVEFSQEELDEFITQEIIPNPYWCYSGLLTREEVTGYLHNEVSRELHIKIARYILIYQENLAFTGYLFDKAEGQPDKTRVFNLPVLNKLRDLYQKVSQLPRTAGEVDSDVHAMENLCLETGGDPL